MTINMGNNGTHSYSTIIDNIEHERVDMPDGKHSTSDKASDRLLDPNLEFDMHIITKNLYKSDKAFAKEVVNLIAQAAEWGIFACTTYGYQFQELPVLEPSFSSDLV
jgi:hypothetical protein